MGFEPTPLDDDQNTTISIYKKYFFNYVNVNNSKQLKLSFKNE